MKKILVWFLCMLIILPSVIAINLNVEQIGEKGVLIQELNQPATFNLEIKNFGQSENFQFYNLLGFEMFPKGTVYIPQGATENVELKIKPISEIDKKGFYTFTYHIKANDGEEQEERLTFEIVPLENAFEVGSSEVDIDSNTISIYLQNLKNFDFGETKVEFESVFFQTEETFDLGPKERVDFDFDLNEEEFKKLKAGFYTLNAEIKTHGETTNIEGTIEFEEKDLLTTTRQDYGFFINNQIIEKNNKGNTIVESETTIKKNIISRLFTTLSPQPDNVERQGFKIYYTWSREINPGESLKINVQTNWLFPFILILFIVAIVIIVKKYSRTNLVIRKRVSHVRSKGGEFALKVTIMLKSQKYIERVNVIDRLPPLVKIYDKFGVEKPDRVDEKSKKIEWNFEKLEAGEVRVLSYIIYSKVGVMGKFALPRATAIFEREGDINESESNRAYFVTEPIEKDKDSDKVDLG